MDILAGIFVQRLAQDVADVVFEDEVFLVETFQQLAAQAIDRLALLVHHVVVFKQVFAGLEVLAFHRLLRGLDTLADHARLDGHTLFHAQPLKQVRDPLLGEDAHQVVFQRQVEAGGARIALAAGASAKLVIDAARFVPLGAENEQTAQANDFVVLLVGIGLVAEQKLVPLVGRDLVLVAAVIEVGQSRDRRAWR